jgi:opacity protein-like surface antigen
MGRRMPRIAAALLTLVLLTAAAAAPAAAQEQRPERDWTGNLNGFFGFKALDEDDWEPVELQGAIGGEIDFRHRSWPISLAAGLRLTSASDEEGIFDIVGSTVELTAGVKKVFEPGRSIVRPFIGGGVALVAARVDRETPAGDVDDDDAGVGFYVDGGIYWLINQQFNIGLDVRYTDAEVTLFDTDREAGGLQVGALLGFHW